MYRSKELLEAIFCYQKKMIKSTACNAKLAVQVCKGVSVPYFKIKTPFSTPLLFFEEYLKLQININKMRNTYTADYHPSSSRLASRTYLLVYWWTLSLSRIFIYLSLKPVYTTMIGKILKSIRSRLLENQFVSQKIESSRFHIWPQSKFLKIYYK